MKIVAEQLYEWAKIQDEKNKLDLFARTAFNRYYYATFLITREMLGELRLTWKKTMHKSIPVVLRESVLRDAKLAIVNQERKGIIKSSDKKRYLETLSTSTAELANILSEAYAVRVVADYEPEIEIAKDEFTSVLYLSNTKLSTAKTWPDKASGHCKTIRSIWKEIGLA